MKISYKKGFTIIELMVVLSIIGVLASISLAMLSPSRAMARDSKRIQEVRQMDLAVNLYKADHNGAVPTFNGDCAYTGTLSLGSACIARSSDAANGNWSKFSDEMAPYIARMPVGSNGIDYVYMAPAALNLGTDDYQISSNLEVAHNNNDVTGYTTSSSGLLSFPPILGATYSLTLRTDPPGSYPGCKVKIRGGVNIFVGTYSCNSVISGLQSGTYYVSYIDGTAGENIEGGINVPVTIISSNIIVTIEFINSIFETETLEVN